MPTVWQDKARLLRFSMAKRGGRGQRGYHSPRSAGRKEGPAAAGNKKTALYITGQTDAA